MKKLMLIGPGSVHTFNFYALIKDFFDEVLILSDKKPDGFENTRFVRSDFSIRNPFKALKNIKFIRRQIISFQPDIIHVHQANSLAFITLRAARKFSVPTIVTAWGSDVLTLPQEGYLLRKMVCYNIGKADYLTADAQFMSQRMKELVPERKLDIMVTNFGIDEITGNENKENIIFSNRLHKKLYRINEVINAFIRFKSVGNEDWKLVIAGSGEETGHLKELAATSPVSDDIEFVGWLEKSENEDYYKKSKIYVSIPESDGTAVSLLEAMSAGCLPLLSDLPANCEWIIHNKNGIIVKNLYADFISGALELNYKEAVMINKELIANKATKKVARENFIRIYKQLLG